MQPPAGISLVLNDRHDVRMAAALARRSGIGRVWTAPGEVLAGDDLVGVICDRDDMPPRTARHIWIRKSWSDPTRALVADCVAAGAEVSADADDVSAADVLAQKAIPVLSLPTLAATLRSAAAVSALVGPAPPQRLAALVAVSPGRTSAEAHARLRLDPDFAQTTTVTCAIVGTLEDCQQAVAALFAAGVSDVRMSIPATPDFPDVLAQLATLRGDVLARVQPGAPRSDAPNPPRDWGGRP